MEIRNLELEKPGTRRNPNPSYVASKRHDEANKQQFPPPLEDCDSEPKRKRRQRRTSSSGSVLSTITEVFDYNAIDGEDMTIKFESASFEDFHPTLKLTKRRSKKRKKVLKY